MCTQLYTRHTCTRTYKYEYKHTHTYSPEFSIIKIYPLPHLAMVTEGAVMLAIVGYQRREVVLVDLGVVRKDMVKQL